MLSAESDGGTLQLQALFLKWPFCSIPVTTTIAINCNFLNRKYHTTIIINTSFTKTFFYMKTDFRTLIHSFVTNIVKKCFWYYLHVPSSYSLIRLTPLSDYSFPSRNNSLIKFSLDTSATVSMCIFSSILNRYYFSQNLIIKA